MRELNYCRSVLRLTTVLLCSAVGNPIGLVGGVASGVVDFFYEPGSALFNNPSDFGSALGKGTMALVGGTIGGSMNTVSRMTGLL